MGEEPKWTCASQLIVVQPSSLPYQQALKMSVHGDDDDNQVRAPAALPRQHRVERPTSSIAVDKFRSGVDDFEEYGEILERGIKVATNVQDPDELGLLCKDWLRLKLDAPALAILRQANTNASWPNLKEELIALLVDPQERYKWQARLTTIKWDQKESFHALASRVRRAVNKFDKDMPQSFKDREYYQRFCDALPKYYRSAIHMGCKPSERNIENAKELALRAQIACSELNGESKSVTFEETSFVAAAMNDSINIDRITSVERSLEAILSSVEDIAAGQRRLEERVSAIEERYHREEQQMYQNLSNPSTRNQRSDPRICVNSDTRGYHGDRATSGYRRDQNQDNNNSRRPNDGRREKNNSGGGRSNTQRGNGGRNSDYCATQMEDEESDLNSDEAEALCAMMAEQMLRAKSKSKRSGR